jgi:hypothetical protein
MYKSGRNAAVKVTVEELYFLHDSAPTHKRATEIDLKKNNNNKKQTIPKQGDVLRHPPYSPELTPCAFFLFHRLKKKS